MTDWDARWEEHITGMGGVCAICNTCGGGRSSSFCECAKRRWIEDEKRYEADFGRRRDATTLCFLCAVPSDSLASVKLLNKPRDLCAKCIVKLMD